MTYRDQERTRAVAWKKTTGVLPPEARLPGTYRNRGTHAFCLPAAHATLSLLPEVRDLALGLFAEQRITWHDGVGRGPSNHLLDSQVQCVNALGQMVADPDRLQRAFGDRLGIAEVLEIEQGRHLTFEFVGPTDYFRESRQGKLVRGLGCTSVDAAFLCRIHDGTTELILLEWKYTETGSARRDPAKDAKRWTQYGEAWADDDGPVRSDVLAFTDILDEPLYQLVRQQLLAHELEKDQVLKAERVRVLQVSAAGNTAYQQALRPNHRAVGDSVSQVWAKLLRRSDRFVSVDSATFLDPDITSSEYTLRYGDG